MSAKGQDERMEALAEAAQADPRFAAAFVFGSAARGRLRPDSDVDLAVVYADHAARRSVEASFLEVLGRLGLAAGRNVHLVDLDAAGHVLRFQVLRHGRRLFERVEEPKGGEEGAGWKAVTTLSYHILHVPTWAYQVGRARGA